MMISDRSITANIHIETDNDQLTKDFTKGFQQFLNSFSKQNKVDFIIAKSHTTYHPKIEINMKVDK